MKMKDGLDGIVKEEVSVKERSNVIMLKGVERKDEKEKDVMRGEEKKIMGIVNSGKRDEIVVMKGKNEKWVKIENGEMED